MTKDCEEYNSMDEYEQHLIKDEPNLVKDLVDYDLKVSRACQSTSSAVVLPKGQARLESLQKILRKPSASSGETSKSVLVDVKKKEPKTLVACIKTDAFKGPIALLCACVKEKVKVRVLIRSRIVLRSILKGYLVAFDKHWNLAMQDVEETYYRRKRTRILAKSKDERKFDDLSYPQKLCYAPVNLRKQSNIEIWTRHLNQLFVKGDEVIIISLIR